MTNNISTYIDYWRQLAITHHLINHDDGSENNDGNVAAKRFCKFGADEVLTGLRTKISTPALLLELYEVQTQGQNFFDIKMPVKGAFMVLKKAAVKNNTEEEEAYQITEEIVYDLLKQTWQQHYGSSAAECTRPFSQFDFNNLTIEPVGPVFDNLFGWRVEFGFKFQRNIDLTAAPAIGTFLT
jgi:hypothetical protein